MRPIASAVLATFLFVSAPIAAFAHAKMTMTVPKDGATVAAGLAEIEVAFSKPMRLTVFKVTGGQTKQETPIKGELPKDFVKSAKLAVDPLAAGAYEVSWTAVADDGHVMNGAFKFTVSDTAAAKPTQ